MVWVDDEVWCGWWVCQIDRHKFVEKSCKFRRLGRLAPSPITHIHVHVHVYIHVCIYSIVLGYHTIHSL